MSFLYWILPCWILMLMCSCKAQVTITTQPRDVTVPLGGTAVFTCLVELDENVGTDDVQWDHMGNVITHLSTNPYVVINDITNEATQLNSTLIITNVMGEHVGPYQFVLDLNDGVVMSRRATLTVLIATITTPPSDVTMCTGEVAVFTCVVDRNGTGITSDDVMWQQIRMDNGQVVPRSGAGTINGDILTSTLTITGATDSNVIGTSSYRCVVRGSDVMSRSATINVVTGPPGPPMNIRASGISNASFIVLWDVVDDADRYFVNWRSGHGVAREAITSRTSHNLTGLIPNTTYYATVTASNSCGKGTASNFLMVITYSWIDIKYPQPISTVTSQITSDVTQLSMPTASTTHTPNYSIKDPSGKDSSSISTGAVVAITFTTTFIITLTVSVVVTFLITFVIVKRKFEKIHKTTHQPTQLMPVYETVNTPAITKSDVKLQANPAYGISSGVVIDDYPAYQSCN